MISVRPRRTAPAVTSTAPPAPIEWRDGLRDRLLRFAGMGAAAGGFLLLVGLVRMAGAFVLGVHLAAPPLPDAIAFGAGYIACFALGGLAVGALWPLRVRRWGRITVDYVGTGVVLAAMMPLISTAAGSSKPLGPVGQFVVWVIMTAAFGTGIMLQNDDMVE